MKTLKNWKIGFVPPRPYSEESATRLLLFFASAKVGEICYFGSGDLPFCLRLFGEFCDYSSDKTKSIDGVLIRSIRKSSPGKLKIVSVNGNKYSIALEDEGSISESPYDRYELIFSESDSPLRLIKHPDGAVLLFDTCGEGDDLSKNLSDEDWLLLVD